ncbi:MAG: phosphatidate cytidylyltransferase [Rickettsiaceae bacterium]|nr:phosphatidate cytidylyltransferase [Rickettsiaceae bacterium]
MSPNRILQFITHNYCLRAISALAIVISFAVGIFCYREIFNIILLVVGILMFIEWKEMTKSNPFFIFIGIPIIIIPITSLLFISYIDQEGWFLFGYFCVIWSVDTIAMITGKIFKGPKLAPYISPNKTISGLIGGCLGAVICTYIIIGLKSDMNFVSVVIYAIVFAILSQMSDLFISIFKRKFKIKDTGKLIPGHGGFLDRFDSIILTAPILALVIINF